MAESLAHKQVVVTAAPQGIGRAAEALAKVVGSNIATRRLDVLDGAAVARVFADLGPVDVLFDCAGVVRSGTILDSTDQDLDVAFDLNVRASGRPEELADLVAYLATATYTTGQIHVIEGGWTA